MGFESNVPLIGRGGFGEVTIFYDTFTDPDGTDITSHVPEIDRSGSGWTKSGSFTSKIYSNQLRPIEPTSGYRWVVMDAQTNVAKITGRMIYVGSGSGWEIGIVCRVKDAFNYIYFGVFDSAGGVISHYRQVSGVPTGRASANFNTHVNANQWFNFSLEMKSNNDLLWKVTNETTGGQAELLRPAYSFNPNEKLHGISTENAGTDSRFDHFKVIEL